MTVVVSIVPALIASLQYGVYRQQRKIMESSGQQTQQLIDYAQSQARAAQEIAAASDKSAAAADRFAMIAEGIKTNTANAVTQLRRTATDSETAIAKASENAQKALDASIEASRVDQRAWAARNLVCKFLNLRSAR
jgi:hypothetical protein